jgi:hypothetical protein
MWWRWLFVPMLLVPAALEVACSASNGDSIPSEVRDAEALDASGPSIGDRDSSTTPGDDSGTTNPPKDGGVKDAPTDTAADAALSSADVRINEIFISQNGGDQAEFIEIRGAVGTPIDDLFLRSIDDKGVTTGEWPVAATATKLGATGTWTLGGGLASGRIDNTIPAFDDWGLDNTKGAVLLLRGASKTVIDAVSWNTDADGGTVMGEGKVFVLSTSGTSSFGRKPPSFGDTNDNLTDFCAMAQSAGATNTACK